MVTQGSRRPGRPKQGEAPSALVVLPASELAFTMPKEQWSKLEAAFNEVADGLNSEESKRAYQREWANFSCFLKDEKAKAVTDAETIDVQDYLRWLRDRPEASGGPLNLFSRARALAVLRAVYGSLVRYGVMKTSPAREAKNPKSSTDRKTPVLSELELTQLVQCVPSENASFAERRDYLIAITASYTGLRRSNLATLAIDKFRQVSDVLWVVPVRIKGDKLKDAEVITALADELFAWCREHDITTGPIFRSTPKSLSAISVGTVRNALKNQARRAGLPDLTKIAPHAFRRTFASMVQSRGISLHDLQRAMMHARIGTTQGYLKYAERPTGVANSFADILPAQLRRKGAVNRSKT